MTKTNHYLTALAILVTLAAMTAVAMVTKGGNAGAATKAGTTVTIKAEGVDLFGKVKSTKLSCLGNRTVKVYKQKGSFPDPRGRDKKLFKDQSNRNGHWDTGNTGQAQGKFYALAERTVSHEQIVCKRGVSKTIKV